MSSKSNESAILSSAYIIIRCGSDRVWPMRSMLYAVCAAGCAGLRALFLSGCAGSKDSMRYAVGS